MHAIVVSITASKFHKIFSKLLTMCLHDLIDFWETKVVFIFVLEIFLQLQSNSSTVLLLYAWLRDTIYERKKLLTSCICKRN